MGLNYKFRVKTPKYFKKVFFPEFVRVSHFIKPFQAIRSDKNVL